MTHEEDATQPLALLSPISSPLPSPVLSPAHPPSPSPPSSPIPSSQVSSRSSTLGPELIEACRYNNGEKILDLIKSGVDVNFKDPVKNITPLFYACRNGNIDTTTLLLSFAARPDILCGKENNQTPLSVSITHNHPQCTRILLERGAEPEWREVVDEAIMGDRAVCLDILLEHGAQVNAEDSFGTTPLHKAAYHGKLACVEVLLNYGANIDAKDLYDMTPYDIAVKQGHEWASILQKNGEIPLLLTNGYHNIEAKKDEHEDEDRYNNISPYIFASKRKREEYMLSSQDSARRYSSATNSLASQDYLSQSLSQSVTDEDKAVNLSTSAYHNLNEAPVHAHSSFSLPMESSQLSQYSQQSQLGSQDLNPLHPPRYVRPNLEIDLPDLELLDEIGSGFYGKVYKGIWQGGTMVAVKQITSTDGKIGEITRKNFRLEMEMLMALRHPNIVLFLGVSIQSPNFFLVMELMPRGSLARVLHSGDGKALGMRKRIRWAMDVACGMNYLHKQSPEPILHRDLKSSNLLVTEDFRVKVSDFGLARVKDGGFKIRNPLDITIQAPEVLRSRPLRYTEKSDIYSYGLLLWELMAVKPLFEKMEPKQIATSVLNNIRPTIPTSCPSALSVLMSKCWDEDPQVRPTFQEIIKELRPLVKLEDTNR